MDDKTCVDTKTCCIKRVRYGRVTSFMNEPQLKEDLNRNAKNLCKKCLSRLRRRCRCRCPHPQTKQIRLTICELLLKRPSLPQTGIQFKSKGQFHQLFLCQSRAAFVQMIIIKDFISHRVCSSWNKYANVTTFIIK